MKLQIISKKEIEVKYLKVKAGVRYWEDGEINGQEDVNGEIQFREGDYWCPVIELETGIIQGWNQGVTASIHYKVCDDGEYWLLDADKKVVAKYTEYYVPNKLLCHGDNGYGDYIKFDIDAEGRIVGYEEPSIEDDEWEANKQGGAA